MINEALRIFPFEVVFACVPKCIAIHELHLTILPKLTALQTVMFGLFSQLENL